MTSLAKKTNPNLTFFSLQLEDLLSLSRVWTAL